MHVDRLEAAFIRLSIVMLSLFAIAILISVFGLGIQLPGVVEEMAPANVRSAPGFDNPGLREIFPGKYEAHIVVQAWSFTPADFTIPVGSEVTFFLASTDIIHGFMVMDTNINIMVIPGQISEFTYTFKEPGDYQFYCHEYCGAAHHTMSGFVHVVEP